MSGSRSPILVLLAGMILAVLVSGLASPARAQTPSQDGTWSILDTGGDAPSARREYAAVFDALNDRYLIFGGFGFAAPDPGGLFNEVWSLSLGLAPQWSRLNIAGPSPGERHSPQWGYDPSRQRVIVFGGYGHHYPGGPNEYLNDVWELSLAGTPAWTELNPVGSPPSGRLAGASIYDPLRQRFVGFGGTVGVPVDTWELDLTGTPTWRTISTVSLSPRAGYGMTPIYDLAHDRMIIFGGSTSDEYYGVHNEVWALQLGTNTWSRIQPLDPSPTPRRSLTSIYDPIRDRMVIFGGWDNLSNQTTSFLGDAWGLSLTGEPRWTQLSPQGGTPTGRDAMAAVYDVVGDRMVVFGGWSGDQMLGDSWFLCWGLPGQAPTMSGSSQADPNLARVTWGVQNVTGTTAAVYRRRPGTPWSSLATIGNDDSGTLRYDDPNVAPGGRYGYQLVVSSRQGAVFGGEVWVDVPSPTGVSDPGPAFALNPVHPNPIAERFVASFALPSAASARLELVDLGGRRIFSREVGSLGPGTHQVEFTRANEYAKGMYFLRLTQDGRSSTTRVVIGGMPGTR